MSEKEKEKVARWYFGGLAGSAAAAVTHPLDLLKANIQTQKERVSIFRFVGKIVREQGILPFYNGISASILRQMTYSLTRFGMYEYGKDYISTQSFEGKLYLAFLAGLLGGFVGTPADMINVRMQNDVKLPFDQRRNYKNAVDGLIRVYQQEGFTKLFSGATTATLRGGLMNAGQLGFYGQVKEWLLRTPYFEDNITTHLAASFAAATVGNTVAEPIDVLKTRAMNAKPGHYKGLVDLITSTAKEGPLTFFKGYIPAFFRLGPHTVLTFIFLEQLTKNFGITPK